MKFSESDVVEVGREFDLRHQPDPYGISLSHPPSGIAVHVWSSNGDAAKAKAMSSLERYVNAYYAAAIYCAYCGAEGHSAKDCSWAAPGIERVKQANTTRAYEIEFGCNWFTLHAEKWLNEQPDHSAISKGPVPSPHVGDPVYEVMAAHSVGFWESGAMVVDFDKLRRTLCERYGVLPY